MYGWNNDTENITFPHWFTRGPTHEDDGECMYILKNIFWDGWYMNRFEYEDYNCSETKHFICEKPGGYLGVPGGGGGYWGRGRVLIHPFSQSFFYTFFINLGLHRCVP